MQLLADGAHQLGIPLTPEHLRAFQTHSDELLEWNRRFNLTAVVSPEQVQVRLFLDSLTCLLALSEATGAPICPAPARLMDVGSGGGFPALPLKVLWPSMDVALLEATGKKVTFLRHVVEHLSLQSVVVLHARAEEAGHQKEHREMYDLVTARAVAELPELLEYTLPFASRGGWLVLPKGSAAPGEAIAAEAALKKLGGRLHRLVPVEIPGLAEPRYIVLVEKVAPTPPEYPRRPGIPHKRPLR